MTAEELQEIVDYYTNLLIIQYHNKTKAKATVDLFINELIASGVMFDVRDGYDLDIAVGVQLDILGKYIGTDRFYYSQDFTADYFGFADAADIPGVSANIVGFNDAVAGLIKEGDFLDSEKVISTLFSLSDESYRKLLKIKIVQNNINYAFKPIVDGLFTFFGLEIIPLHNTDMSITYLIADNPKNDFFINALIQKECLPKPAGVSLQVLNNNSFFGFADAASLTSIPDYIKGFNDAVAGLIKDGGFLNADGGIRS
jgi:hypothetical protein